MSKLSEEYRSCHRKCEARAPVKTDAELPAAKLELAEVTYGVTVLGHAAPETKKDTG
jgi:hypothetical protein